MIRLKIVIRNIIIIVILFFLFLNRLGLHFTPLSAHENSERSIHFGPSKVLHTEGFEKGMYLLGKYDGKWVSCNTVNKALFFFWRFGSQVTGFEIDKTKAINYSLSASDYNYYKAYGIINDKTINKIQITLDYGAILETTTFYEDLFLITWKATEEEGNYIKAIRGYDKANNIIFEDIR